jgi:hypothetical protein
MEQRDRIDQATQARIPFGRGWWGTDLGAYRGCDGTYCFFPYESLPPLPPRDETLSWLGPLPEHLDREMEVHRSYAPEKRGRIDTIAAQAQQLGLTLPPAFLRLMGSHKLQDRIPSCSACFFILSERIVPCPAAEQGYIVRFLNDQQDVLLWYLYLTREDQRPPEPAGRRAVPPTCEAQSPRVRSKRRSSEAGDACVIVSPYELDGPEDAEEGESLTDVARHNILRHNILTNTVVCAPTFDEFIYRFWLENTLWFKLNEAGATLTPAEHAYAAHYAQAKSDG